MKKRSLLSVLGAAALATTIMAQQPTFAQSATEVQAYEAAIAAGTIEALEAFMTAFPNSVFAAEVAAFAEAVAAGTPAAMQSFLTAFPNSPLAAAAFNEINASVSGTTTTSTGSVSTSAIY